MEYERDTHIIAPQTGDKPALGNGWQKYTAAPISNGMVRLTYPFKRKPAIFLFSDIVRVIMQPYLFKAAKILSWKNLK